jgi:hypothetical protein
VPVPPKGARATAPFPASPRPYLPGFACHPEERSDEGSALVVAFVFSGAPSLRFLQGLQAPTSVVGVSDVLAAYQLGIFAF